MCGLVGLINKNSNGFTKEQQAIFSDLLFIDYVRGPDSTGAVLIDNNGNVKGAKEASDSITFLRSKAYDELMTGAWRNGSAMIGHNRKATRGNVNDENAHPFVVDNNIVLVHNGTLWGDHKKHAEVEVDSHAIAHVIHEKGNVEEALNSIDGAYALMWYNVAEGKLNIIRNSQRPLWWMELHSAWVWSSEKAMLDFVISRHTLRPKEGPTELPENTLQEYTLKNNSWACDFREIKMKTKVYQTTYPIHESRHPYANAYMGCEYDVCGIEEPMQPAPWTKPQRSTLLFEAIPPQGTVGAYEWKLAKDKECIVAHGEFNEDVIVKYTYGTKAICRAFDYTYATTVDDKGGFYLYLQICDDTDKIVRLWLDSNVTEERVFQIAGGNYIYECTLERKQWFPMATGPVNARTPGYVIFQAAPGAPILFDNQVPTKDEVDANVH